MKRIVSSMFVLFCLTISYSFGAQGPHSGDSGFPKFQLIKNGDNEGQGINPDRTVKVEDGRLLVDFDGNGVYAPFLIKGVAYSPVPIGRSLSDWGDPYGREDNLFADEEILARDFSLLKQMHANTIRIWKGNDTQEGTRFQTKLTKDTLDTAESYGLKVIAGFYMPPSSFNVEWGIDYSYCDDPVPSQDCEELLDKFKAYVDEFKDHPAILFWAIGNENNQDLNKIENLHDRQKQREGFYFLANRMAEEGKNISGMDYRPMAVVNGDIHDIGLAETSDENLEYIDIWGANAYRGRSFNDIFNEFAGKSSKAFWISEYGIDAVNDLEEDQITQAEWDGDLWDEIFHAYIKTLTIGGTIMEYSDEWWKPWSEDDGCQGDGCGDDRHQFDGYPCPEQPDGFCHEEWWGIVSIAPAPNLNDPNLVTPREVYRTLQSKWFVSHPEPFQAPAQYE